MHTKKEGLVSLKVGIREYPGQLPHYLLEVGQPLAITRNGETIKYYIHTHDKTGSKDPKALRAAAHKLDTLIQESGIDPDEMVELFNVKRHKTNNVGT